MRDGIIFDSIYTCLVLFQFMENTSWYQSKTILLKCLLIYYYLMIEAVNNTTVLSIIMGVNWVLWGINFELVLDGNNKNHKTHTKLALFSFIP